MEQFIKFYISILVISSAVNAFTVDVVNITNCKSSKDESGTLSTNFESKKNPDQLLNAKFHLPIDLNEDTMVEYESKAWVNGKWKFLFSGKRSFCNSITHTIAYNSFAKKVRPKFPRRCTVPEGHYRIDRFPISGQYVVLSDIRKAARIVKHKLNVWVDDELILCRVIITMSKN